MSRQLYEDKQRRQKLTWEQLAQEVGLSKNQLALLIRYHFSDSFKDFTGLDHVVFRRSDVILLRYLKEHTTWSTPQD